MKRLFNCLLILIMLTGLVAHAEETAVQLIDCRQDKSLSTFAEGEELMEICFPEIYGCNGAVVRVGETVIVIDACTSQQYPQMEKLLGKMGITKIDYCINTHPDNDHAAGFMKILRGYEVGCMITGFPNEDHWEGYQEKILNVCAEVGVPTVRYGEGDSLEIGDLRLDFVQRYDPDVDGINNSSLIVKLTYKGRTALFPGDIQAVTQLLLGDPESTSDVSAELINWPHHGYNRMQTSFFERVGAKIYIITSGPGDAKNSVKQVKEETEGARYFYTDSSRIRIVTNGDHWEVYSN